MPALPQLSMSSMPASTIAGRHDADRLAVQVENPHTMFFAQWGVLEEVTVVDDEAMTFFMSAPAQVAEGGRIFAGGLRRAGRSSSVATVGTSRLFWGRNESR